MNPRTIAIIATGALVSLALAQQPPQGGDQQPPPPGKGKQGGGQGNRQGRGARKPPQDGIVKPSMSDTIKGAMYADNWFMLYVNGKQVAVDSIDFLPHNVVAI
ncbi:MAG: hypothetical protein RL005_1279, partial [Planctomycetota bacterium]